MLPISKRKKYFIRRLLTISAFVSMLFVAIGISFLGRPISDYSPNDQLQKSNSTSPILEAAPSSSSITKREVSGVNNDALISWKISLQEGLSLKLVPTNLNPPLRNLKNESEYWRNCFAKTNTVTCSYGNSNAGADKTAIIYGDSYAISILPAILGSLDLSTWRVDVLTFGECMISDVTPLHNGKEVSGCNSFRNWARSYIREHPHSILFATDNPDVTIQGTDGNIVYSPGTTMNKYWQKQLRFSISQLISAQRLFVFIGQTPQPSQSLGQCISSALEISSKCYGNIQSRLGPRNLEKSIFNSESTYYFDLQEVLCLRELCPPIISSTPVFLDGSHLSYQIAIKLIPYFKYQLSKNGIFNSLN